MAAYIYTVVRGHYMKRLPCLVVVLLALPFIFSPVHGATDPSAAEIVSISGTGEYRADQEGIWADAWITQHLTAGDFVRTGQFSRMGLLFNDRAQIRLSQNTVLRFKPAGPADTGQGGNTLELDRGRVWTRTRDIPRGLIMETPSATAAIRGTEWDLEVDENGAATITVLNGEIAFYNDFGRILVRKNEQAYAEIGKAPVKMIIVRPADRVQWVTAYTVDPLRHIRLYPGYSAELDVREDQILDRISQGYAALFRHRTQDAETWFKGVPAGSPHQELLDLGWVVTDVQSRRFSSARDRLHVLIGRQDLNQPAAYLILSDLMVYAGEIAQALDYMAACLRRFGQNADLYSQMARIYLLSGRNDLAGAVIEKALVLDPNSYEAMLVQGDLARINGQAKDAISIYKKAAAVRPDDDRAWYGLGVIYSEKEDVAAARVNLVRAIDLNPHVPGYYGEKGTLESFADNFDMARVAFNHTLENNPADYIALTGKGVMLLKQGRPRDALDSFLRAGLLEPRYARSRLYTGVAYHQLGNFSQALSELEQAALLDDKDPMPHLLSSIIYNDLLQPGDAIREARQAMKLMPYLKSLNQLANTRRGTTNLGQAFAFMGMEDWARMHANDSFSPFWAGSHLFLADRYAGQFTKNSELFQGFISDPTVFGSGTRFQSLVNSPGHHFNFSFRMSESDYFSGNSPFIELNGFDNAWVPAAYYLAWETVDFDFDTGPYDTSTVTIALGARPIHNIGVFGFTDHSALETSHQKNHEGFFFDFTEDLTTDREDVGISYKVSPVSQIWFKIGRFRSDDQVEGFITDPFFMIPQDMDMDVKINAPELAFRHTFHPADRHEVSWGAETARRKTSMHYEQYDVLDSFFIWDTPAFDVIHQEYSERSTDFYVSDRFRINDRFLVQLDLFYQDVKREVHEDFEWIFPFFPGMTFQQAPDVHDRFTERHFSPRIGLVYHWDDNKRVRLAYQNWIRPPSQGSLGPVATAGIPLEDRLVSRGGELKRYRGMFEWEFSNQTFLSAGVDHKIIDNNPFSVTLPFSISDLENLNKLRSRDLGALTRQDLFEFIRTPEYEAGKIQSIDLSFNHLLTSQWGLFGKYVYTISENTGKRFNKNVIPYLPDHTVAFGVTWAHPSGWYLVGRLVYRSDRFIDEANTVELESGFDGAAELYWQSKNKNWLFRLAVDDAIDTNKPTQYTTELCFRY